MNLTGLAWQCQMKYMILFLLQKRLDYLMLFCFLLVLLRASARQWRRRWAWLWAWWEELLLAWMLMLLKEAMRCTRTTSCCLSTSCLHKGGEHKGGGRAGGRGQARSGAAHQGAGSAAPMVGAACQPASLLQCIVVCAHQQPRCPAAASLTVTTTNSAWESGQATSVSATRRRRNQRVQMKSTPPVSRQSRTNRMRRGSG